MGNWRMKGGNEKDANWMQQAIERDDFLRHVFPTSRLATANLATRLETFLGYNHDSINTEERIVSEDVNKFKNEIASIIDKGKETVDDLKLNRKEFKKNLKKINNDLKKMKIEKKNGIATILCNPVIHILCSEGKASRKALKRSKRSLKKKIKEIDEEIVDLSLKKESEVASVAENFFKSWAQGDTVFI